MSIKTDVFFWEIFRTRKGQKVQETFTNDDDGNDGQDGTHGTPYDVDDQGESDQSTVIK